LFDRPDFDRLVAEAAGVEPGAEGLALRSDGGPTRLAEMFANRTSRHARGHEVRCLLEAVAAALAEQVAGLAPDAPPPEIRCAGGAARSDLWLQIKADMLGVPTVVTECSEPTCLGAAALAEAALGSADLRQVVRQWVRAKTVHRPDPQRTEVYRSLRAGPADMPLGACYDA
jgi:xylulokinase